MVNLTSRSLKSGLAGVAALTLLPACTVAVKAPTEPITINLNVKIDQEVRIRLDKEVDDLIADNPDLFGPEPGS